MLQSRFVCVSCVLREIRKCDCMDVVDSMCRVTLGTQEQWSGCDKKDCEAGNRSEGQSEK